MQRPAGNAAAVLSQAGRVVLLQPQRLQHRRQPHLVLHPGGAEREGEIITTELTGLLRFVDCLAPDPHGVPPGGQATKPPRKPARQADNAAKMTQRNDSAKTTQ